MDIPCATRGGVVHQRNARSAARRYRTNCCGRIILNGQRAGGIVVELKRGGISQRGCVRQPERVPTRTDQLLIEIRCCRQCRYAARSGNGLQALTNAVDRDVFICITQNNGVGPGRCGYTCAAIRYTNR